MAAYTIYDVIRHLAERAQWPSEEDRRAAIASVTEAESMGVLGNVATRLECPHDEIVRGRCVDCNRTMEVGQSPGYVSRQPHAYQQSTWR